MSGNTTGPEFRRLWPTLFMSMQLPGAEAANGVLAQVLLEEDRKQADLTGDYLGGALMEMKHPAIDWLKQCFDRAVADYAAEAGIAYELAWNVQA